MSRSGRRPRVFIGLTEVAGYYTNLERGLRELGVDARFFDTSGNPSRFASRGMLGTLKGPATRVSTFRTAKRWSVRGVVFRLAATGLRITRSASRLALFPIALWRYDVFVFHGLDSFLAHRDLPILKRFGKRIIYVFNGSDHRPPYLNGKWVRQLPERGPAWLANESRVFADRVATVERYADCVVALSASAQFHRKPFVQFLALGLPFASPAAPDQQGAAGAFKSDAVRILHCPTDPVSKGSAIVRAAIGQLRTHGHAIEFVEITGRPNAEVLGAIQDCDFVVDEVWSDTPMAGLATEAAFFGKPTVVSGYFAREIGPDFAEWPLPPTLFCEPDDLRDGIERLIVDPAFRRDLGERAQAYVRDRSAPRAVAARFLRVVGGDVPADWIYDPMNLRYVLGWGLPEDLVREGVRAVLHVAGPAGLYVGHNPELEARLLDLGGEHGR